jgi:uncharacterized protein
LSTLLAAAAVAALVVGFLKTSIGGGIGLVLTPTLSLVLPAQVVLALTAPLMNLSDPITLRYYWRRWDARQLRLLMPTTLAGIVLGAWIVAALPEVWLRRLIGLTALAFALVQLLLIRRGRSLFGADPAWPAGAGAGLLTGVASTVAHSGGVVLGLYLIGTALGPAQIVATASALVAVSNVLKLGAYWRIGFLSPSILLAALAAAPLLLAGAWLGYRVNRVLPRRVFELVLIAIAVAGSIRLLLSR